MTRAKAKELNANGRLIVFEGADEVGKTSLSKKLADKLRMFDEDVVEFAFPGNAPGTLGAHIYELHHRPSKHLVPQLSPDSLQVLHLAAHLDAIERQIIPALMANKTVILDRFWWSTHAYGLASGVKPAMMQKIIELEKLKWGGFTPTIVFYIKRSHPLVPLSDMKYWHQVVSEYDKLLIQEKERTPTFSVNNDHDIEGALKNIWAQIGTVKESSIQQGVKKASSHSLSQPKRLNIHVSLSPAKPSVVYDTYWRFAAERQQVFYRKLSSPFGPWTSDPILCEHKFTNAYRASDRVSQFLIKNVQNEGDQTPEELFFRTILFKTFNRIPTWELLKRKIGDIKYSTYNFESYDRVLSQAIANSPPIYSAAYIMTSGRTAFGEARKHRNHLKLIERMMADEVPRRITDGRSMSELFELLVSYPTLGDFLAYQYATDLNYSRLTNYSEMEFVVPGPGARDGLRKCFIDFGGLNEADMIRFVTERQEIEFERLGINFSSLWGRPLQLIDCQNLFCEVDKYARLKHPEIKGISGRTRIKQKYRPNDQPINYFYPPKWGINDKIAEGVSYV